MNSPGKDASVSEAKPVGLAIAGVGGVASSKPSATAVVGPGKFHLFSNSFMLMKTLNKRPFLLASSLHPGGLAIARPSAIAIAGVSPEDVSNLGIPIPQKKIIKKNYTGLSSRTSATAAAANGQLRSGTFGGQYRSTMLKTPYGDIKILIGPDYKPSREVSSGSINTDDQLKAITPMDTASEEADRTGVMAINSVGGHNNEDEEILAEDFQDPVVVAEQAMNSVLDGNSAADDRDGFAKYDQMMAVAPVENLLNRYPLAPPKFTGYVQSQQQQQPMFRGNFGPLGNVAAYNPGSAALYYPNLAPVNAPYNYNYNYGYPSYPFQAAAAGAAVPPPLYYGY